MHVDHVLVSGHVTTILKMHQRIVLFIHLTVISLKRADGNPNTHAFVTSPEMVAAIAISGRLDFNPITDTLTNNNGEEVKLDEPTGWEFTF